MNCNGLEFDLENNQVWIKRHALVACIEMDSIYRRASSWRMYRAITTELFYKSANYQEANENEVAYPLNYFIFFDVKHNPCNPWEQPRKSFHMYLSVEGVAALEDFLRPCWENFNSDVPFSFFELYAHFIQMQAERKRRGERWQHALTPRITIQNP